MADTGLLRGYGVVATGGGTVTGQAIAVGGGHHLRAGPDFRSFTGLTTDQLLAQDI
jgi:hypothetical protein